MFVFALLVSFTVQAQNVKPLYQYVKLPCDSNSNCQGVFEIQNFGMPIAASTGRVKASGYVGPTSAAAVTLTSFNDQPDVPRNLTITPGGTTADVGTCTITVSGTDIRNHSISEDFAFAANASSATTGTKAFKTVTSVVFPANCEDSPWTASWAIGVGEKIGLRNCIDDAGAWNYSSLSGVKEGTAATVVASASTLSLNTADFNGTMNGASTFKGYYIQNFRCY